MNFYALPSFIPTSVVGAPMEFRWEGAQAHIGPVETVTPLMKLLWNTTTCAEIALCAGVMLWGTWRFKGAAEVEHNLELAEAAFAWGVDWRYVDVDAGPKGKPPDQPPPVSATMKINSFMRRALSHQKYWDSYYQPVSETFHSAHIVRHVLPRTEKPVFEQWLESVAARIKRFFPKPDDEPLEYDTFENDEAYNEFVAPHRGLAVPPQLLDPAFEYRPQQRDALVSAFLAGLDPSRNRYLRTPNEMMALGFAGVPYRVT